MRSLPPLVLMLVALGACGQSLGRLERPTLVRSQGNGLCGSTVAVDARGEVWTEGGCENGPIVMHSRGMAKPEPLARLRAEFDAITAGVVCPDDGLYHEVVRYIRQGAEDDVVFSVCLENGGLPAAFWALDAAFDGVVP